MFDAKSLLEQVAQAASQRSSTATSGDGGLGDIFSRVSAAVQEAGAKGATQGGPAPGGAAQGGFGDILAKLQQTASEATGGAGGLTETMRQVLAQATEGVKTASGDSGLTAAARNAVGQMSGGQTPEELVGKLKTLVQDNQLAAGAIAGALGTLLVGTGAGRDVAGGIAKIGAGALIGGLAYSAYQNHRAGKPLIGAGQPAEVAAAPAGSGFEPQAMSNDTARRLIRAMIAAAACDGNIDDVEKARIMGAVTKSGSSGEAQAFLEAEMRTPASIEALVAGVGSEAEALEVYTAARIAIDTDQVAETAFLARLARGLKLDPALVAHVDASMRQGI